MDESIVWIKEATTAPAPTGAAAVSTDATIILSNATNAATYQPQLPSSTQIPSQQQTVAWNNQTTTMPNIIDNATLLKTDVSPATLLNFNNDVMGAGKPTAEQFDVAQYERKLREDTQQTVHLLDTLCDFSDRLKLQQKSTLIRLQEEQIKCYQATEQMQKVMQQNCDLTGRRDQLEREVEALKLAAIELKKEVNKKAGVDWHNVDSARIGECFLREPSGAIMLPNTNVLVTDSQLGLFLFTLNSDLIRNVSNVDWRWPQAATLLPSGYILLSMMVRESSATPWRRFIMKFDTELNFVAKVEGPKWLENETILREKLCASPDGTIYFMVGGETFSAIYELSTEAKWTELENKRGQSFVDAQVLATIGPVTEILVVEERRGYLHVLSVRDSVVAMRRNMTPVEKPGVMAVDENGQVFLHDRRSGKVRRLHTGGDSFEAQEDAALAEKSLYSLSANAGFIAAAYREGNQVRIHKYRSMK